MLVEINNLVSSREFRKNLEQYIAAAKGGSGPVGVTEDSQVVGFFISRKEYEALYGAATQELLAARMKGPTVSHEEVREHIRKLVRRGRKS